MARTRADRGASSHSIEREIGASDTLLVPTGGGGLSAGCCLAMAELSPSTAVFAVEPEGYDDHVQSLSAGER